MNRLRTGAARATNSVSLLISILVRYPEVASVTYNPEATLLKFTFLLARSISGRRFRRVDHQLRKSLDAYGRLEGHPAPGVQLSATTHGGVSVLEMRHDAHSLSREMLSLMIEVVRAELGDLLAIEPNPSLLEEDLAVQEEVIEEMLEDLRESGQDRNLIAFREEGRVLVFNR
ncbi:MAG: hypothetical protein RDU89_00010 [bacterium]|nr:hypothetical protein [bacterium]